MLDDFLSLIYPRVCMACGNSLYKGERCLCTFCVFHLPRTNFHLSDNNPVSHLFWGRIGLHSAAAFYYFSKEGKVQHLIHQLKYKGQKEIGLVLGKLYGPDLKQSDLFSTVDAVVPVPLHQEKLKKRGYNQSEYYALGLAEGMGVPCYPNALERSLASETQTKKSRYHRWENVAEVFRLPDNKALQGKHVLLVDDVITTGATIEACARKMMETEGLKISVASIAFARL